MTLEIYKLYFKWSSNLPSYIDDAIKVLERDTFIISIHQESYSINIPFLIYRNGYFHIEIYYKYP